MNSDDIPQSKCGPFELTSQSSVRCMKCKRSAAPAKYYDTYQDSVQDLIDGCDEAEDTTEA